jgi:uncharacterized small protein (DUF1192 family)
MMSQDTRRPDRAERLAELERECAELIASLPKHSVTAAQLLRIEDLEEQIAVLHAELESESADQPASD